jgi:hypothetical protein
MWQMYVLHHPISACRCHFNLPSVEAEEETHSKLPPIKVKFEIPYFTVSGMQVRQQLLWCCAHWFCGLAAALLGVHCFL